MSCTKNKHRFLFRCPSSLSVILHVSTLKLWLRQQWDEGCFSIGYLSAKTFHLALCSCLLHRLWRAVHAEIYLIMRLCTSSWREGDGEMKAEINEVSGTVQLLGHCPKEKVWGRPAFINCGEARGNPNTRNVERVQRLVTQVEERH